MVIIPRQVTEKRDGIFDHPIMRCIPERVVLRSPSGDRFQRVEIVLYGNAHIPEDHPETDLGVSLIPLLSVPDNL